MGIPDFSFTKAGVYMDGHMIAPGQAAMISKAFAGRVGARFWLLALVQAAHSIEEMRTGLYDFMWEATPRLGLPRMGMSAVSFAVVNMAIIAVLLALVPFVGGERSWSLAVAWIVAVVEVANGVGHLTGAVIFRRYVPGAATAPLLILCGLALMSALRRSGKEAAGPAGQRRPI
ncbi:MAG TPA: HXXEE domain-containing protein [Thermoanaerobaculia bacterium]|nr:HXXEE domain-containing protein [Thermoanaerobaculia bacterium]